MQALYSLEINPDVTLATLESDLDKNIDRSVALYLTNLSYLVEICQYSLVDKARRMAKYIKTEEDELASTLIAANRIVVYLQNNKSYNDHLKQYKIHNYIDVEVTKAMFNMLHDKYTYKNYIANTAPTLEQDQEVVGLIVKKILAKNKEFEAQLEDNFINYDDDQQLLNHVMQKYVEGFNEEDENAFMAGVYQWEEEKKFGIDLLKKCYKHNEELTADIEPNLKNWEMDRIAAIDLILMKMAVCELKYFPTVPIKVSINEYIDISKIYSTPKSKDFVNGVLDKTKLQLMEKGLVNKQGRGLVDS
ncbi:MAG: NusB antitermination factor [Bacteroidetes bacterium]|nr:NusB antitermination factor [Bacteroidota bacterium]